MLLLKKIVIKRARIVVEPDMEGVIDLEYVAGPSQHTSTEKPKITKKGFASVYTSHEKLSMQYWKSRLMNSQILQSLFSVLTRC